MTSVDRRHTARVGEQLAAAHLARLGMAVIETNWRCGLGEIDLVASDSGCLVFAEVRTRRSARFGTPEESIGPRKQRKLIALAESYVSQSHWSGPWRVDVVAVVLGPGDAVQRITHYPGAVGG